jgi:ATP-dependent protease ClpP protease subunit
MRLIFEKDITRESSQEFCDAVILGINNLEESEKLHIYFSTDGGYHHSIYPIIDVILEHQDKIELHIDHVMYSSGFLILLYLRNIPIRLKPSFKNAMIHTMYFEVSTADNRKKQEERELKKRNKDIQKHLEKIGLTDRELKRFKNQKDVYFSRERLLEIFPNIKKDEY